MLVGECFAGTGLKIGLEFLSLNFSLEGDVANDAPGFEFAGVWRLTCIMCHESSSQICRTANVILSLVFMTTQ